MRILITGGGGFIGCWLAKWLIDNGHEAVLFDLSADDTRLRDIAGPSAEQTTLIQGDITDAASVMKAGEGCDAAVNLAGLLTPACKDDPLMGAKVNVLGALHVFEAARVHGYSGVAYATSSGVFCPEDGELPFPITHYGAFKLANEGSARAYWHDHGVASVGFRPTVVYGPGRDSGLTAGPTLAMRAAVRGELYVIPVGGEMDMLYVEDVAEGFARAALNTPAGASVYNMTGEVMSVEGIVDTIRAAVPDADISADGPVMPNAVRLIGPNQVSLFPDMAVTDFAAGTQRTLDHYWRVEGKNR